MIACISRHFSSRPLEIVVPRVPGGLGTSRPGGFLWDYYSRALAETTTWDLPEENLQSLIGLSKTPGQAEPQTTTTSGKLSLLLLGVVDTPGTILTFFPWLSEADARRVCRWTGTDQDPP